MRKNDQVGARAQRSPSAGPPNTERQRADAADTLPQRIGSFLEDFQALDTRRAKALLQTILKAAHVYRDGQIELEFRT